MYKAGKLKKVKNRFHDHIDLVGQVFDSYGSEDAKNKIISRYYERLLWRYDQLLFDDYQSYNENTYTFQHNGHNYTLNPFPWTYHAD